MEVGLFSFLAFFTCRMCWRYKVTAKTRGRKMSKKMKCAYSALKVSDAVDAAIGKFQIIVIAIGLVSCAAMYFRLVNPMVVLVSFAVLAVIALLVSFIGIGAQIAIKALGYSEVDLERMGLA